MMNGPLGGNMGTPPAPSQPPQVNFTTTAESRGGFSNFLKSIPNTTAMTPLPPMGSSPMPPMGGNPMGNIDIFNQPPSTGMGMMGMNQPQMNPMMQQPMQPPMMNQQPMMMADGGGVPPRRTEIMGQDHMLSYITPEEGGILKALGGAGAPGPMGIPSFFDAGEGMGGYGGGDSATDDNNDDNNDFSFSDDVGVGNAGDFTVGDTEDRSQSDAYQSALDNITLGSDDKAFEDDSAFRGVNVGLENTGNFTTGVLPGSRGERFARFYNPNYALRGIGRDFQTKIGNNPNLTAGDYFETFTPSSENPGGTGNRMAEFTTATGKGPNDILSLNDMNNIMDIQGKYEAGIRNNPAGQIEKISTTVPMDNSKDVANVLANLDLSKDLALDKAPTVPSTQFDMFGNVIGSTPPNDPSAGLRNVADVLKGGESLTYDPVQNKISFSSADDNRSRSQDRNIDQVPYETLNRGLDTFDSVRAGLNFDDPKVKDTTDIFSPSASDFANFQSTRDQLPNVDGFAIQPTFQNFGLPGANLPTIGSARSTVAQDQAKALANLVGDRDQTIGEKLQQNILEERGRALGPTTFSDDLANFSANVRGQTPTEISRVGDDQLAIDAAERAAKGASTVGDDFQTALDLVDARQKELTARDANVRDMDDIDRASAGRASDFPTVSTMPENFEENVGRKFDADRMADIERLYNRNVGQTKAGKGTDPGFFEGLGVPGIATTIGDFIEKTSRENMANEIALGRPMGLGETLFGYDAPSMFVNDKGVGLVPNREGDKLVPNFRGTPGMTMEEYMANTQKNVLNEAGDSETVSRRIPESQLVRNDSGRIIGIYNEKGRLVSGYDPDAPVDTGDDNDSNQLIRRLPLVKTVADVEKDKTPNVFGGGQTTTTKPKSVVVDSPFTTNVGDYSPTGFDSGDLNALIARLLKTSNPKSMAQGGVAEYAGGGLISAVDNFLASV